MDSSLGSSLFKYVINSDSKLSRISIIYIQTMLKINFSDIFDAEDAPKVPTKQAETEAGSLSGNDISVREKNPPLGNNILIQDQLPPSNYCNNPEHCSNRILPGTRLYFQHQEKMRHREYERKIIESQL